jgi:hypothetical protein
MAAHVLDTIQLSRQHITETADSRQQTADSWQQTADREERVPSVVSSNK